MSTLSHPDVKVTEVTSEREKIVGADTPNPPNLGGEHSHLAEIMESRVSSIQAGIRAQQQRVFELTWTGNKVPRGAVILGKKVAWTQHGLVTADDRTQIGTYDRTVEFGGEDGKQQKMLVYVTTPEIITGK